MVEGLKLTKNERLTLKMILDNSRVSDIQIAGKLKISSQAVGKIRKKLEENIITSYSVNLNYAKLGIQTFAIATAKLTNNGLDKGELEIEQVLHKNPHVIQVYRLPRGSSTHILVYGFNDINDLDSFFHSQKNREELHKHLEIKDIYTFSHNSCIKNNPVQLFHKVIDNLDSDKRFGYKEIEKFRKNIL